MKKKGFAITAAVCTLALLLGLTGCSQTGAAATPTTVPAAAEETVTVSASSTVRLTPDKATLTLGVTTEGSTAEQAQSDNSESVDRVVKTLTERGVDEKSIRTARYSIYPRYDYSGSTARLTGYEVRTTLTVQDQDIDSVGKLLSDCVAAGVNTVDDVSFLCSGYDEAYRQSLAEAVDTARQKAGALAKAAGKTLGETVTVTEGWQDTSFRYGRSANVYYDTAEAEAAISFMPGESEIAANVTVTFRMQ